MASINTARVILGGLVAGLIINISEFVLNMPVLGQDWQQIMISINRPTETTGTQIAGYNIMGFAIGVFTIWLYAAIRPRFGAGPRTAVIAGCAVWVLGYLLALIPPAMMGLFTTKMLAITLPWSLVEMLIASNVGARLYREE